MDPLFRNMLQAGAVRYWAGRLALAAGALIAALVVVIIGFCYLAEAIYQALAGAGLDLAVAALITGGCGLAAAGLFALIAKLALRRRTAPAAAAGAKIADVAAGLGSSVAAGLAGTARARPYGTVGAALAAGFVVGALPELRKALLGLFSRH